MKLKMNTKTTKILRPDSLNTKARAALDEVVLALLLGVAVTVTVAVGEEDFALEVALELAFVLSKGDITCYFI
jgi:hypothetical protein